MSISQNYPELAPSFSANFTAGFLDPRLTFSRAETEQTASYYDKYGVLKFAAIGTPRFRYIPDTLISLGLAVEQSVTNFITYSEDISNTAWVKTRSTVTSNSSTAPDGQVTADKLIEDTTFGTHGISNSYSSFVSGTTYVFSCYFKPAERTILRLSVTGTVGGSNSFVVFDTTTLTTTIGSNASTNSTITNINNGWYRCSIVFTALASGTANCNVELCNAAGESSYTGTSSYGAFVWGFQLTTQNTGSYIKTTSASKTKHADTNIGSSVLGSQGQGTIVVEARAFTGQTIFSSGTASIVSNSGAFRKYVLAYDSTGSLLSINGGQAVAGSATTASTSFNILPGATGFIRSLHIYPKKLSADIIQKLSVFTDPNV